MSKLKVSGNASGTGVITLEAPNTNTDRTITLPDSSDTLVSTAPGTSGNILTSDGTNWTSAAPAAGGADTSLSNLSSTGENKVCQAWVNFNGTGTVAIRDSHNVSSITDIGTGDYKVNFATSLNNTDYAVATSFIGYVGGYGGVMSSCTSNGGTTPSTSGFDLDVSYAITYGHNVDIDYIHAIVFGD